MSKNSLPRVATSLFNTPLLVRGDELDAVLSVVGPRILAGMPLVEGEAVEKRTHALRDPTAKRFGAGGYMANDGIAVLPVIGRMVRRATWLDSLCDMTSYQTLVEAATDILMDGGVRGLMLEMDTPGGEANGVFDAANVIKRMAAAVGKPIWAHANEQADSAGYVIACIGEEFWMAQTAEVGSIGVVCAHIDMSGADEKAGHRWTYVYAGESKVDGNPHEPLSTGARADLQADADDLYSLFIDHVSDNRGLSADQIRGTKAKSYRGSRAIEAGLTDKVGTLDEALTAFGNRLNNSSQPVRSRAAATAFRSQAMSGATDTTTAPETQPAASPATTQPAPATPAASAPTAPAPVVPAVPAAASADALAAAASAETARCTELAAISAQASSLGVAFDLGKAIADRVTASSARQTVLEAAANRDAARQSTPGYVPSAHGGGGGSGGNKTLSAPEKSAAWKKALGR